MADYATMPLEDLHAASASVRDINKRGQIVSTLMQRTMEAKTIAEKETIWPSKQMREREEFAGLYPDPADPQFAARLYQKKEFYEARSVVAGVADGSIDPCSSNAAHSFFELTPVQRVVARFMPPEHHLTACYFITELEWVKPVLLLRSQRIFSHKTP